MNCEKLDDDLQVSWLIEGDVITIELAGNIDRNKDYMAFGLSGSETATAMINADVVVADFRDNDMPRAIDYHLTSYAQCAGNGGACPDTSSSNSAADDVMTVTGQVTNGITRVKYQRALTTGDVGTNKDKVFKVDGSQQTIVWAIGPLNTKMEAAKHYNGKRQSTTTLTKINFNRTVADNCPSFVVLDDVELPDFQPHHLYGEEGTVFTVEIGQAGSEQGYKALTGLPSWGIAWYVNGILIPELHLKRGVSYTFRVGGGTDPKEGSKYHPLYFTNDVEGGYNQTGNGTIYPGKVDGNAMQYAVGGYCEWKLRSSAVARLDSGFIYPCFETFQKDLYLDCDNTGEYTDFVFTPDSSTPDLLYYQCYTHKSLGWKVHVYDELPTNRIADIPCLAESFATCSSVSISLLILLALLNLLFV
ncbi:hypothetical protein EB796_022771 [Bugula neritina]|uniref:DOMON domain-containing protein n=1 Tax=Bugula neritina TaxID=10212 RepID=A0A7J7IYK6_BUGNE|nr:hypothetical protein EB796_022771 [Bugula neritina]